VSGLAGEGPAEVVVRIDKLVVETEQPVDASALRQALAAAVQEVIADRGWPQECLRDTWTPMSVIDGFAWDGRGGESGLAQALAAGLYEHALAPGGSR
jgi:hypothetical protein